MTWVLGSLFCWGTAAAAPSPTKVTIFLFSEGLSPEVKAEVSHSLVKGLRDNERLQVKDPDKLLVEFAGERPNAAIDTAKRALEVGLKLLRAGKSEKAEARFRQAISTMEPILGFLKKKLLADAYMGLGVARAQLGDRMMAAKIFTQVLTWRPQLRYDTQRFSPRFLPLFTKAQAKAKRLPRGSVELTTTPPGVNAYVDGRFIGITPTVAFGLMVGDHYATYKKAGFIKAAQKITVNPRLQGKTHQELRQSEKHLLLTQALGKIRGELNSEKATPSMLDLRSFLYIDQVIFGQVKRMGASTVHLKTSLYDLRSKIRLNQAKRTVDFKKGTGSVALSRALYHNVRYDGMLQAPEEPPPPPPPKRTPLYATWWFWTAIAAGAAGVIIPVALVSSDSDSCVEGARCVTLRN